MLIESVIPRHTSLWIFVTLLRVDAEEAYVMFGLDRMVALRFIPLVQSIIFRGVHIEFTLVPSLDEGHDATLFAMDVHSRLSAPCHYKRHLQLIRHCILKFYFNQNVYAVCRVINLKITAF